MDLNALRRLAGIATPDVKSVSPDSPAYDFRRLAGLAALPVAEAPEEEKEVDLDDMDVEASEELPPEEMPEDELPSIVSSIAAEAEGKTGDELAQLIKQVYDAGVADGKSQAEESEVEAEAEEASDAEEEPEVKEDEKPVDEAAKQAVQTDVKETDHCPSCSSADVKMHSDGEKECNDCHKTWDVQGVKENKMSSFDLIKQAAALSK